jgi:hypothetical protein
MADAYLIIPSPPLPLNKATTAMPRTHPHVHLLLLQLPSSQVGGAFTQCLEEDMFPQTCPQFFSPVFLYDFHMMFNVCNHFFVWLKQKLVN